MTEDRTFCTDLNINCRYSMLRNDKQGTIMTSNTMNTLKFIALIGLLVFSTHVFASSQLPLKSTEVDFYNQTTQQPVKVKFWYQSQAEECSAQICLAAHQSKRKVAMISHGAFGSPIEMNWLGYALASQGYLVAGVAHYGESWMYGKQSIDPSVLMRFWQRPQEISFAIDKLSEPGLLSITVDTNNILMLGHSAGGFTALALAGSTLEAGKTERYCQSVKAARDKSCDYGSTPKSNALNLAEMTTHQAKMFDNRINAIIALDPALGHAVNDNSLQKINVPTLIIGSVENDFLPYEQHAKHYAEHIDNAQLIGVKQGAGHFVYINACQHEHKAKGVSLCKDREGVDRKAIQQQLLGHVFSFIAREHS